MRPMQILSQAGLAGGSPFFRQNGQVIATMEQFARLEEVLGPYGGQLSSFDWVFPQGKIRAHPWLMFDRGHRLRQTGCGLLARPL